MGYAINIVTEAKTFLCEKGFDVNFGARPLKRAIQKYLENPMAEILIRQSQKGGEVIQIDFDEEKDELTFNIVEANEVDTVVSELDEKEIVYDEQNNTGS